MNEQQKTEDGKIPLERLISYPKAWVEKVCRALVEDHASFDTGDYSYDQYECEYCGGRTGEWAAYEEIETIKHEMDCPVLVARDLLTGS